MVVSAELHVRTRGPDDLVDLTEPAQEALRESALRRGIATFCVVGSTAALTTIEFEPGLCEDFPAALERLAPADLRYAHEEKWHDDNGHSHVRASLIGPSLTIPVIDGRLTLGAWQQIVLVECDTRPRDRTVVVQLMGE